MQQIQTTEFRLPEKTVITLGKFDGVHRGHQKLLQAVKGYQKQGYESVVFTFSVPPAAIVKGQQSGQLMTSEEQVQALEAEGIQWLISYPCDRALIETAAEDFIRDILVQKCHAGVIVVGTDCCFGYQRRGNYRMLQQYASEYGYQVEVIDKEIDVETGLEISSTLVREELSLGRIERVNQLLGYPYSFCGEVVHGMQLARKLGFPTMNLFPCESKAVPPAGVYCVRACVDGKLYEGIANLGYKPTVTEERRLLLETFLFDFHEISYGKTISVMLYFFVRAEQKFETIQALQMQMTRDIAFGKNFFAQSEKGNRISVNDRL